MSIYWAEIGDDLNQELVGVSATALAIHHI